MEYDNGWGKAFFAKSILYTDKKFYISLKLCFSASANILLKIDNLKIGSYSFIIAFCMLQLLMLLSNNLAIFFILYIYKCN